jgi:hypothetical protein
MKKELYKSTFVVTVLHEEPNFYPNSLEILAYQINEGDCVGEWVKTGEEKKVGYDAVQAVYDVGSDVEFFSMDHDGNDVDSDD